MSYRGESDMTLGGFLVFLAACGLLLFGVGVAYQSCTGSTRRENAEKQAVEYASALHPGVTATVQCQSQDTDNNGYLSCTLRVGKDVLAIECSNFFSVDTNHGCRPERAVLQGQQPQ